jgi:hypothetical protein
MPTSGGFDATASRRFAEIVQRTEPFAESWEFDNRLDPSTVRIEMGEGFDAPGRFDVRWFNDDRYSIHYKEPATLGTNPTLEFRFDRHSKPGVADAHFHPPPDAGDPEDSCIQVRRTKLVAIAVGKLWRAAWNTGDLGLLNTARNPP